jgi:uncharacterized membrane protein YdjX (TVP38/TMEM64 family)
MTSTHRRIIDVVVTVIASGLILWGFWSFFQGQVVFDLISNNTVQFRDYLLNNAGPLTGVVFVALVALEVVIAFIPGWFVYPVGGVIFGVFNSILLILLGNFIAASICFWIGRKWGQQLLGKFIAKKYLDQFNDYMTRRGSWAMFLLKINPITSLDLWNYVAGASPMSYWKFSAANILGILPLVVFSAVVGVEGYKIAPQALGALVLVTIIYFIWLIVNLPHRVKANRRDEL